MTGHILVEFLNSNMNRILSYVSRLINIYIYLKKKEIRLSPEFSKQHYNLESEARTIIAYFKKREKHKNQPTKDSPRK